jgi:hypothetical protein
MYMDLTFFNTQNRHMILTNDAAGTILFTKILTY